MIYRNLQDRLPEPIRRYVLHFESEITISVHSFAQSLPAKARVLDAGAGEGAYRHEFSNQRYTGIDLGVGDVGWNYSTLDAVADLTSIPLAGDTFDAVINIVTLEHVKEPARVIQELGRVLKPGGRLLLIVPHEWEEHQTPHDYFRYTRYGVRYLLENAGFERIETNPVGGFFRLLSRRLFNAVQFFPGPLLIVWAIFFALPALLTPLLDPLDKRQNFTLGFICTAQKRS